MKLENWSVVSKTPYSAPEMGLSFHGNVYGHPRFEDGHIITTSKIMEFKKGKFITYSGSQYELGKVDEEYERIYPNAFARIMESFNESSTETC